LRILQVIHQFPPHSFQGSEVYCFNLSRHLNQSEAVRVFHVSNARRGWPRRVRRETSEGIQAYHCIDGGEYARIADWPNHFLRRSFETTLNDFCPEIVHFHNFLSLGDDLVSLARASSASVVYTLHDYGLICPNALLLRDDGVLCRKQNPDFFQDCCPFLIRTHRQDRKHAWRARLPSLARWQLYARQHPRPLSRRLLLAITACAARWMGDPRQDDFQRKRDFFFTHTQRIFHDVDLFIAPSDFLLRRYLSCGLPAHKAILAKYGLRHFPAATRVERRGPIRFGYIGALHPQKGLELLLEAFRGIGDDAVLHVFGSAFGSPISKSFWRRIRGDASANVVFRGPYHNDRVQEVLSGLDVIVVPSIWYENSPLTIHEAFIAHIPVVTADVGGMAELVRDGIDGLHFRLGDVTDLREKLIHIIDHPETIDRLRRGIPTVSTIEEHAAELLVRYRQLVRDPTVAREASP
jgi:glycosyltransferase involved in cell wall biosynthesis